MRHILKIIISLPGTIWFNFRYFHLITALKLPVWIASNVRVKSMYRGGIVINNNARTGLIRIGYHEADAVDPYGTHTILSVENNGKLIFVEDAHIGQGAIIKVKQNGTVTCGSNFAISGTTSIICSKAISFGKDVQLSWNSLIIDSDAHKIFGSDGIQINPNKEITIGNNVWIAANTTILKGTVICDNTVVASNSLVNSPLDYGSCIIGGSPAKVLKNIGHFEI